MTRRVLTRIGWREWLSLPELGIERIKAKIDTGARSSTLHAAELEIVEKSQIPWVQFVIWPTQGTRQGAMRLEHPVFDFRTVRSSNGVESHRPVIVTSVNLGGKTFPIELTLVDRDSMDFRMLLGRTAVRRRFLVHPGRSYLLGRDPGQGPR
jgi:hypothetical protein